MIYFNQPEISARDTEVLASAISSGHCSGNGPFTKKVESLLQQELNLPRALLTTSCTHALEISALLLNLKPGDEVIVPSFTFVSTASAFAIFGGVPIFVDSRRDTLNIDASLIENAITDRTRAICVVHYGGVSCEMEKIIELAERHGLTVIEDNAHGLFSKYKGKYLGTFGTLATQSFHETKNIICGEGGALLINDDSLIERAETLREKGTNRSRFLRGQVDKYTWVDVGSSWVMSDLLAAILWSQLERAESINARRMDIWNTYHAELSRWASEFGVLRPTVPDGCEHVGHVYHLRFKSGRERTSYIDHMKARGIACVFHYQALHTSPVGVRFGGKPGQCPVAEHAGESLVRLPLYNSLTNEQQCRVIEATLQFSC